MVKFLIESKPEMINVKNDNGETPLLMAIRKGNCFKQFDNKQCASISVFAMPIEPMIRKMSYKDHIT